MTERMYANRWHPRWNHILHRPNRKAMEVVFIAMGNNINKAVDRFKLTKIAAQQLEIQILCLSNLQAYTC